MRNMGKAHSKSTVSVPLKVKYIIIKKKVSAGLGMNSVILMLQVDINPRQRLII